MADLYIGTSGWSYDDWKGRFYPEKIQNKDMLPYYMNYFDTVEVNATFYRLPFPNMIKGWKNKVKAGFKYAIKGHRRITHFKKLQGVQDDLNQFLERIEPLQPHTAALLWQFPPRFHKNLERLEEFLQRLPGSYRHVFEFRNQSWFNDEEVHEMLQSYNACQAWISSSGMTMDTSVTSHFIYLRFHGLVDGYQHYYTEEELRPWVEPVQNALKEGREVFVYFNNDYMANGIENARQFKEMVLES